MSHTDPVLQRQASPQHSPVESASPTQDHGSSAGQQPAIQRAANHSSSVMQQRSMQQAANNSPQVMQQQKLQSAANGEAMQLQEFEPAPAKLTWEDNEYESLAAFQQATGESALGSYQWIKADRLSQSGSWITACENITRDQAQGKLLPFAQVRDYYIWVTRTLDGMGHESRWVKGALYLVNELTNKYEGGMKMGTWSATEVIPLLEELNVGIVDYAITQFHRLMYGDLKDNPLQGDDAYEFDKQFIQTEQGQVAFEVYSRYEGTKALDTMNGMFTKESWLGWAASFVASEIPTHQKHIQADLNDPETNFGQDARTNIPLYMLYPDQHRSGIYAEVDRLMDLQEYEKIFQPSTWERKFWLEDPDGVYKSYSRVNETIMDKEW